jgi:formate dehydrogenase assembly factor FdhD
VAGFCLAEGISLIRWMTVSRPTALALDLASQLNITLATQSKGHRARSGPGFPAKHHFGHAIKG